MLKKVLLDPEIKAAQKAVDTALARVNLALSDEVFGEKGKVEGKVIDQLKIARTRLLDARKALFIAQKLDKGID